MNGLTSQYRDQKASFSLKEKVPAEQGDEVLLFVVGGSLGIAE